MWLFKKYCPVCGTRVDKAKAIKCFSEYLCSEEHANEYRETVKKALSKPRGGGGCCG